MHRQRVALAFCLTPALSSRERRDQSAELSKALAPFRARRAAKAAERRAKRHAKYMRNRERVLDIVRSVYGEREAERWLQRWRIFFMACAELWGYDQGREWLVSHYRMGKREV